MALILQCCKSLPLRNVTKVCKNCSLSENNARWRRIPVSCCLLVTNKLVGRCRPRSQKHEVRLSCPTDLGVAFSDLSVKKEKPAYCGGFWIEVLDVASWSQKRGTKLSNLCADFIFKFRCVCNCNCVEQPHQTSVPIRSTPPITLLFVKTIPSFDLPVPLHRVDNFHKNHGNSMRLIFCFIL